MTDACERWMEISDRLMVGEQVSAHEREFLRVHATTCGDCGVEATALRELKPLPLHSVPGHEEVDQILRAALAAGGEAAEAGKGAARRPHAAEELDEDLQAETTLLYVPKVSQVSEPARKRRWVVGVFASGAAVAAAAAGLLAFGHLSKPVEQARVQPSHESAHRDSPASPTEAPAGAGRLGSNQASAEPAQTVAHESITRNQEDTCGEILAGVTLCLTRGSEVSRVELGGSERSVHLERGRAIASLAPQPPGTSFSIVTPSGRVTAVGTVFSVEVNAEGASVARVTRGKVLVRAPGAAADHALLAGQMLKLGDRESLRLSRSEQQQDLSLLDSLAPDSPGIVAHGADSPGTGGHADEPRTRRASRNVKDELLRARELRKHGDFAAAAGVYRSIHQDNPQSPAGRAALLSLAGLLLAPLNDPSAALNAYNAYLAGGQGTLAPQAEYGRIRALRSLGRANEERAAIDAFLKRYPNAPEARVLMQPKAPNSAKPRRDSP